jgi:hypothetical protein
VPKTDPGRRQLFRAGAWCNERLVQPLRQCGRAEISGALGDLAPSCPSLCATVTPAVLQRSRLQHCSACAQTWCLINSCSKATSDEACRLVSKLRRQLSRADRAREGGGTRSGHDPRWHRCLQPVLRRRLWRANARAAYEVDRSSCDHRSQLQPEHDAARRRPRQRVHPPARSAAPHTGCAEGHPSPHRARYPTRPRSQARVQGRWHGALQRRFWHVGWSVSDVARSAAASALVCAAAIAADGA